MAKNHNAPWTRDELLLALDLYFAEGARSQAHPAVIELSQTLNSLPIHPTSGDEFRTPNSVSLKLYNFQSLDPGAPPGMERGGKNTETVWTEFGSDPAQVHKLATAIRAAATEAPPATEQEHSAPEGKLLWRVHRRHERSPKLASKLKTQAIASHGFLRCEACEVIPEHIYGLAGRSAIECHHRLPLADGVNRVTRLRDLALLCATCHRAIHAQQPLLSVEAFRATLP